MDLKIIDNGASTWYQNIGAYALAHAFRENVTFHPGTKYMVKSDDWIEGQPTLVETTVEEDLSDLQLQPKQPGSPQVDKAADDAAAIAAVAKHIDSKKPHLSKAQAKADAAALAASQAELAAREAQVSAETTRQTG